MVVLTKKGKIHESPRDSNDSLELFLEEWDVAHSVGPLHRMHSPGFKPGIGVYNVKYPQS